MFVYKLVDNFDNTYGSYTFREVLKHNSCSEIKDTISAEAVRHCPKLSTSEFGAPFLYEFIPACPETCQEILDSILTKENNDLTKLAKHEFANYVLEELAKNDQNCSEQISKNVVMLEKMSFKT